MSRGSTLGRGAGGSGLLLGESSLLLSGGFCGEVGDLVEDGGVGYGVFKEVVAEAPTGWRIRDSLKDLSYDCETLLDYSLVVVVG
jgi:hypothetical protein